MGIVVDKKGANWFIRNSVLYAVIRPIPMLAIIVVPNRGYYEYEYEIFSNHESKLKAYGRVNTKRDVYEDIHKHMRSLERNELTLAIVTIENERGKKL